SQRIQQAKSKWLHSPLGPPLKGWNVGKITQWKIGTLEYSREHMIEAIPNIPTFHYSIIPLFLLLLSFIFPVRIFRVFQLPQRPAAPHLGQGLEIVFRRRRGCGPL